MKTGMKKTIILALCVMLIAALTACGGGGGDGDGDGNKAEKYIVSTEPTYPPFDTTDENGEVTGFDMDLMQAIAEDQGFEVEFQTLEFDALIPALQSDNTDIVIAGMKATDERKEQVDFSDPYYKTAVYILVKADNDEITNWDSFTADKGYKVAVQTGTTCEASGERLKEKGLVSEVVSLNQVTVALQQLKSGNVDAVLVDKPVGAEIQMTQGDSFKMVGDMDPESEGEFGIAVKKGNSQILDKINAGLANVIENGTYDELCKKWKISVE